MKITNTISLFWAFCLIPLCACEDYFEVKSNKALVVPSELEDFQALLDNEDQMMNQDVALTFVGSDNYYILDAMWPSLFLNAARNGYIWAEEIFEGETAGDWNVPYEQVFISNVVLDGLESLEIDESKRNEWNQIKGSALFFRSYAFYNLLQIFAPPFNPATASEELGIPLRLDMEINAPVKRSGLLECYKEVTNSLQKAAGLLKNTTANRTRPDKAAAYGMLSRVYLTMQDYEKAKAYADSCLILQSNLMKYSEMDTASTNPFPQYNEEVIFHSVLLAYLVYMVAHVDQDLYSTYAGGDLRRQLFFEVNEGTGHIDFTGTYTDQIQIFSGIATDEIYLIRAECQARLGDVESAMSDLNTLLESRWEQGTFLPLTAIDKMEALRIILQERRKELLFRGLRWTDLRRLNQTPAFAKTLKRTLNGVTYTLPPNDLRYVYPIPEQEIDISGISQNLR